MTSSFDGSEFRHILGHYPTGVCAITAMADHAPIGMVVGSFTSISLDPPLVGFFPDRSSRTWPRIREQGRFCVNVLAAEQQDVCRALSSKATDKFAALPYRLSGGGSPILDKVVAWIDCTIEAVHEAGDHLIVVGHVHALAIEHPGEPMLFLRGCYGRFLDGDSDRTDRPAPGAVVAA